MVLLVFAPRMMCIFVFLAQKHISHCFMMYNKVLIPLRSEKCCHMVARLQSRLTFFFLKMLLISNPHVRNVQTSMCDFFFFYRFRM